MRLFLISLFGFIFSICYASQGLLEPSANSALMIDDMKSAVEKMKNLLGQAPEAHSLEKKQAFISIGELEKEIQKFSALFNKKRTILIQSESKLKEDSDDISEDDKDLEGDDNTTQEEAEQLLIDLTNKIWKTTEQILHAHTGISGLVGAIPPQIIK